MSTVKRVLRGGTRNQSIADYEKIDLFTFGERTYEASLINKTGADLTVEEGLLIKRHTTDPTKIEAITTGTAAELAKVIGILWAKEEVVLANDADLPACYAYKGEIDGGQLVLPGTATLDTLVGDKTLRDLLTDLGFRVNSVTELSKFDN